MSVLHIYCRVSTDTQEENTSLANQQEKGISLANRLGLDHKIWNEGAASSSKDTLDNRPVLKSLLKEIQDGGVKHLYAEYTDRLSRNQQTWAAIRYTIKDNDVLYYSGGDETPVDLTDPTDNLLFGILSELASFENDVRTRRLHTGKFNRVKEGKWHGGAPPYGYRIGEDKTLEIEPTEAPWVKRAHEYIAGQKSIRDIRELFRENFVRTRRGNMVWSLGSVERMLQNTHHGGHYVVTDSSSKQTYRIDCPAIVSREVKSYVDAYFSNRSPKNKVRTPRQKKTYLLQDFIYCGCDCNNNKWRVENNRNRNAYFCPSSVERYRTTKKDYAVCDGLKSVKISQTDDFVWEAVLDTMSSSHIFRETIKQTALQEGSITADKAQIKRLNRQLKEAERDLKKTTEGIGVLQGQLLVEGSKDEILAARKSLELRRERLRDTIDGIRQTISHSEEGSKWRNWVEDFDEKIALLRVETDVEERLKFLKEVVDAIYIKTIDKKNNLLELDVRFKMPYVGDVLQWKSDKKSDGYEIIDGGNSLKKDMRRIDGRT